MFTVCAGLVLRSKYVLFPIICSLQYSININTVEVDPHSDLLHICIVKPKNYILYVTNEHFGNMNCTNVNGLCHNIVFPVLYWKSNWSATGALYG